MEAREHALRRPDPVARGGWAPAFEGRRRLTSSPRCSSPARPRCRAPLDILRPPAGRHRLPNRVGTFPPWATVKGDVPRPSARNLLQHHARGRGPASPSSTSASNVPAREKFVEGDQAGSRPDVVGFSAFLDDDDADVQGEHQPPLEERPGIPRPGHRHGRRRAPRDPGVRPTRSGADGLLGLTRVVGGQGRPRELIPAQSAPAVPA